MLLAAALSGCGSADRSVRPDDASARVYEAEADASPEELYFELVRLHSAGLLEPGRMDAIRRTLDELDGRYEEGTEAHHEQMRVALASALRRALRDMRRGEDAAVAEAWYEGHAYAGKLYRAGVREAERHAENTLLIAGMMGVPTSEEDLVLMVAIPVGGYVVVKVGGMALKHAAFLMRKLRSVDDVVDRAKALGLRVKYAADEAELRRVAGDEAAETALRTELHVGTNDEPFVGKKNPWNPSNRKDNCTACVATVIHNSLEGYFEHSADELERLFGYAGRERQFNPEKSLRYIEKATGLKASSKPVAMIGGRAPVGHYAVFTHWREGNYHHVVYGRVTPTGRVIIFDPQSMTHMSYAQMLKEAGGRAMPYLLEATE
ncbi:hypothetical protein DAT35_07810 [Vitiosangium sp. GDMCC 1.1324]|nr:hypothetical protein DAT35_07810 [Vitiosangium sp. GDMCC 1.1324]